MIEDMNKGMNLSGGLILDDDKRKFLELKEQFEANSKQLTEHGKFNNLNMLLILFRENFRRKTRGTEN